MSYFLALDAGGTKTDYALGDETSELARVRTGTIKRMRTDADSAARNLDAALSELSSLTGVSLRSVKRTCVGTAGEAVPLVTDWLRESIGKRVGGELILVGDVEIALDAAFRGGAGVLVLAGTGSNVAGRTRGGVLTSAGGWGPAIADQGSGHRIGQEGIRAAFLAADEGRATILMQEVLALWELGSREELVAFANRQPAPDFSRVAEVVLRCGELGDEVAQAVLREQGEELARLVRVVVRRLLSAEKERPDGSTLWLPRIAFAGSIMQNFLPVREALIHEVRREFPGIWTMDSVVDPIQGALWRARGGSI